MNIENINAIKCPYKVMHINNVMLSSAVDMTVMRERVKQMISKNRAVQNTLKEIYENITEIYKYK